MNFILQPWHLLLASLASWVHHERQKVIEFYQVQLKAELDTRGRSDCSCPMSIDGCWQLKASPSVVRH